MDGVTRGTATCAVFGWSQHSFTYCAVVVCHALVICVRLVTDHCVCRVVCQRAEQRARLWGRNTAHVRCCWCCSALGAVGVEACRVARLTSACAVIDRQQLSNGQPLTLHRPSHNGHGQIRRVRAPLQHTALVHRAAQRTSHVAGLRPSVNLNSGLASCFSDVHSPYHPSNQPRTSEATSTALVAHGVRIASRTAPTAPHSQHVNPNTTTSAPTLHY